MKAELDGYAAIYRCGNLMVIEYILRYHEYVLK